MSERITPETARVGQVVYLSAMPFPMATRENWPLWGRELAYVVVRHDNKLRAVQLHSAGDRFPCDPLLDSRSFYPDIYSAIGMAMNAELHQKRLTMNGLKNDIAALDSNLRSLLGLQKRMEAECPPSQ